MTALTPEHYQLLLERVVGGGGIGANMVVVGMLAEIIKKYGLDYQATMRDAVHVFNERHAGALPAYLPPPVPLNSVYDLDLSKWRRLCGEISADKRTAQNG